MSTPDTITQISLDQLHESPFNPRKTFLDIEQLATTIMAEGGILSPLLVRPRTQFGGTGNNQTVEDGGFEIVFGHRRFRAAEHLRLATVPCMVRAMTDAEARSAQIAENLARADVHPIEEAEGFQAMIDNDGLSKDDLAVKVGKSRSYVYGRLKLLEACAQVRMACLMGDIGSEVALLIARLRTDKLQQKALARISAVGADLKDGGKASYRRIRAELAEKFTLKLKDSMFEREDATLLAGAGVCSACPKRCGNAPEFEDVATKGISRWDREQDGEPDLCTDPDCWEAKTKAHLQRKADALADQGKVMVTGAKARAAIGADGELKNGYVPLAKVKDALKKVADKPQVQHVQDPRTGKVVQAVLHTDLVAAGLAKPEAKPEAKTKAAKPDYAAEQRKRDEEWKRREEEDRVETERRRALLQAVRQAGAGRERTEFELRLVTAAALGGVPWEDRPTLVWLYDVKSFEQLQARVDKMNASDLTALLLDCAVADNVQVRHGNGRDKPGPLLALATAYGIDAKPFLAPPPAPKEAASTPSTAGAGAKKGDGKAKPAKAAAKGPLRGVAYRDKLTGNTWSGKGLQPAWLKEKLAAGFLLSDFDIKKVSDEAGSAGADRDPNTADMFETAHA